jgi:DNA-binding beta-propeller fold protein YncE
MYKRITVSLLAATSLFAVVLAVGVSLTVPAHAADDDTNTAAEKRLLYVASPGVRNYVDWGGHGVLVFDIDDGHSFVRRIPFGGFGSDGKPLNVKGVCASAATGRLYVSTLEHLICLDLVTEEVLWQRSYDGGCDRMSIAPDGSHIYLPTLERDHWKVVDGATGDVITRVAPDSGAHNTVYGVDGRHAYLAGLRSSLLTVTDTSNHKVIGTVGPFSGSIRPFTVNGTSTLCFVNVNDLLGFEVGDLRTGKMLHRVAVEGFERGKVKRHGCPSHGIGMTPDEREIWVSDGANHRVHIFDATVMPPRQLASIKLREQPGWVTFSIDGTLAYPSTGEVIDVATREIVARLKDETGRDVHSEKLLEIDFAAGRPIRNGDQFGRGQRR